MSTLVWDLEIKARIIEGRGGWSSPEDDDALAAGLAVQGWANAHKAGISCAVAYEVERRRYHVFGDTLDEHKALAEMLAAADIVVGWNHVQFDYPVLAEAAGMPLAYLTDMGAPPGLRDWDLLQMLWTGRGGNARFGSGNKLDEISRATLGSTIGGKIGEGQRAPELYQQGRWGELVNYCLRDVDLTARLYERVREGAPLITNDGRIVTCRHPSAWWPR